MDIRSYLEEEGIEGRMDCREFERLKALLPLDQKTALDKNNVNIEYDPRLLKNHYALLAKAGILNKSHALLYEEILAHAQVIAEHLKPYHSILDAGCSDALKLCYYAHHCPESKFLGIDYCLDAVALAEDRIRRRKIMNVQVKMLDVEHIETLRETFDCITATNMLHERYEHGFDTVGNFTWVQDIATGIYYLSQVLQTGGQLIFTLHFEKDYIKEIITDMKINPALEESRLTVESQEDITFNHFDHKTINGLWICRKI